MDVEKVSRDLELFTHRPQTIEHHFSLARVGTKSGTTPHFTRQFQSPLHLIKGTSESGHIARLPLRELHTLHQPPSNFPKLRIVPLGRTNCPSTRKLRALHNTMSHSMAAQAPGLSSYLKSLRSTPVEASIEHFIAYEQQSLHDSQR